MKIFKSEQVRDIDSYTIKNEPVDSIDLMERAAKAFTTWFTRLIDSSRPVMVFCGPGNNGGDGFALARMLLERNYRVNACLVSFSNKLSNDCRINMERLREIDPKALIVADSEEKLPPLDPGFTVVDAIFGSGLSRPAEGLAAEAIHHMNNSGANIVSVDIPSGLYGEDNRENNPDNIIKASYTVTFQFPFLSFFFAENAEYIGEWNAVDIGLHPEAIKKTASSYQLLTTEYVSRFIKPRKKFTHKGTYGHALIISGCYGMMGAAVLTTHACLRTGAGLVTAHIPRFGYDILQTSIPEALISIDQSDILFSEAPDLKPFDAVGVGPGLACKSNSGKGIYSLLTKVEKPLVVDADAINLIAKNKDWIEHLPPRTIITPHPKEFDRLAGESNSMYERHIKQLEFAREHNLIVVLKGANTIVADPEGNSWINTTGNPGMASGGSGDVLTGMIVSLLAQGFDNIDAAITGVYLHGLAGDLALKEESEESLLATDIISHIGKAYKKLHGYNK